MKKAAITLSIEPHHRKPVARLFFEQDYKFTSKVKSLPGSILCMRRKFWCTVNLSLAKFKSALDRFFGNKVNDSNMLRK